MRFPSHGATLCTLILLLLGIHSRSVENDWPIIGVFTQPSPDGVAECGGDGAGELQARRLAAGPEQDQQWSHARLEVRGVEARAVQHDGIRELWR